MSKFEDLLDEMISGLEAKKEQSDAIVLQARVRIKSENDLIAQSEDAIEDYEKEIKSFRRLLLAYKEDQSEKEEKHQQVQDWIMHQKSKPDSTTDSDLETLAITQDIDIEEIIEKAAEEARDSPPEDSQAA